MTDAATNTPSVVDRTRHADAGGPIVGAHFLGRTAVLVLAEEALLFVPEEGEERRVTVHGGGILSIASDGAQIVTGGDDGKAVTTGAKGEPDILATDDKRRWIDRVATGPDGAVAWSSGKTVFVRAAKGEVRTLETPSSPGGLAFAPKGLRLAISHYNGVTLWFPNAKAAPESLNWKGVHYDVVFSPDGKFVMTSMQEPTLHGWRLVDGKDMRMSGYPSKTRSLAWTAKGRFLATSGANAAILWPFHFKDGPMGKEPAQLAAREVLVTRVASHPREELVAIGYQDGMVMLATVSDAKETLLRRSGGGSVSALAFDQKGARLAFGTEEGAGGLITL